MDDPLASIIRPGLGKCAHVFLLVQGRIKRASCAISHQTLAAWCAAGRAFFLPKSWLRPDQDARTSWKCCGQKPVLKMLIQASSWRIDVANIACLLNYATFVTGLAHGPLEPGSCVDDDTGFDGTN